MRVTDSGMTMEVNPVHPENADEPICVTFVGIWSADSPAHPEKVELLMAVNPDGRVTDLSPLQRENAEEPI